MGDKNISYYKKVVEVDTINGLPLQVELWCSNVNPKTCSFINKAPVIFKCEICGKQFDENRKLILHRNYHTSRKNKDFES